MTIVKSTVSQDFDQDGLDFEPLSIDNRAGFPQEFEHLLGDAAYRLRLYVNLPALAITEDDDFFDLPAKGGHLAVRVARAEGEDERVLFERKVVPGLRYAFENVVIEFPRQRVARLHLNGQGEHGSEVVGRIARQ